MQSLRDILLRDMENMQAELAESSSSLLSQRELLQAAIFQLRRRLTKSSSRLEEAESGCLKMSASVEDCCARNEPLQQQLRQLGQDLAALGVHPDAREDLTAPAERLAELLSCLELRARSEDQLSRSRATGASLELRAHECRAANQDLQQRLLALRSARALAERRSARQAFRPEQACVRSLRQALAASEASEARLRASIDGRAASFAKETEPLYSEVQQLHELQHSQENGRSASVLE